MYVADWDPCAFFRDQGYGEEPRRAVETALTLTGVATNAEALGCSDYLRRTWPQSGQDFLDLLRSVVSSGAQIGKEFSDGTTMQAAAQNSEFVLTATGPPDTVVEIGEQLAWVASALRSSGPRAASVIPSVGRVIQTGQTPSCVSMTIELEFSLSSEEKSPANDRNGECWQMLFSESTTVQGYPIQQRSGPISGLEMPIGLMAKLTETKRISVFKGRPFIKGFDIMLFAAERFEDVVLWHVLSNEDGSYIQYHDPKGSVVCPETLQMSTPSSIRELVQARNVVGWCSAVTTMVGMMTSKLPSLGFRSCHTDI